MGTLRALFAFLTVATTAGAGAAPQGGIALPTSSTSGTDAAREAANRDGVAHLIRAADLPEVLFHWTSPGVAKQMERTGIKISATGQSTDGGRSGEGFSVSDRIHHWTNLSPDYRPVLFAQDGKLRFIGTAWLQEKGRYPTLAEAKRYGIDGFQTYTELVLYNSEHLRRLSPDEAHPHIVEALRAIEPTRNLGDSIRNLAKDHLSPEEHADFVPRSYIAGLLTPQDPLAWLARNPTRRALRNMIQIGLHPEGKYGVAPLEDALAVSVGQRGLSKEEVMVRRQVRKAIGPLSKSIDRTSFETGTALYEKQRPKVLRELNRLAASRARR